jgi:Family of unknown function (DUF5762)
MTTSFWANNPMVLIDKKKMLELIPSTSMSFEGNLNAISRSIIVLSILGYLFTMNIRFLMMGVLTLLIIYGVYIYSKKKLVNSLVKKEGFEEQVGRVPQESNANVSLGSVLNDGFYELNKKNPMGNVLLTEIMDDPNRKSAPPSFNPEVYDTINSSAKRAVQMMNPDIINTNKQLFGDLASNYDFDWSMRNFYTMPNTRVTNDGMSFAMYLYGNMPSSHDDTPLGNLQRYKDNYRYILM